jgi:hypothetical protein
MQLAFYKIEYLDLHKLKNKKKEPKAVKSLVS